MSETNAPEPTMEEILASIRRIISEDDAPAPAAEETTASPADPPEPSYAPPEPEPAYAQPKAEAAAPPPEDVLELTERVEPKAESAPVPKAEPQPEFEPAYAAKDDGLELAPSPAPPAPAPRPASGSLGDLDFATTPAAGSVGAPVPRASPAMRGDEPLVGSGAAGLAADHFGALASTLAMPAEGRTLEDLVREMLRPMLKEWLDAHLPAIVETRVQDEVERISRRRTY